MELEVRDERWPLAESFRIARGAKAEAHVVVVELREGACVGRGECVPYARYGESIEGVKRAIEGLRPQVHTGVDRATLATLLPRGAARNALDCAAWELEAKRAGVTVAERAGLPAPGAVTTAFTLSLGTPEETEARARAAASRPLLKLKLDGRGDRARIEAARRGAPGARLIVDANESWAPDLYRELAPALAGLGVELLEQPFPAGGDACLAELPRPVAVCADESCHDRADLDALGDRYDAVNVKLDKAGGLTHALALCEEARRRGLRIMLGCMVSTSLAMAPALLLAPFASWVDLDGPLLLARDRDGGLVARGSELRPSGLLWGGI